MWGTGKKCFGGAIFGKISPKKFEGGILGGKFMLGGVWSGRNAGKFKKKEFCTNIWGGGNFGGTLGEKKFGALFGSYIF